MGVDILRDPGTGGQPNLPKLREVVDKLGSRGVQTAVVLNPPAQMQQGGLAPAERKKRLDAKLPRIEEVARALRGKVTYYELGNEPDLPFFYPGPIREYVESFEQMSDAVRRGNPDAVVANGGLSFHGDEGEPRSREFVQIVNPEKLDAWGFHGHGAGVEAERDALRRIRRTVAEFNQPTDKIYFETESGFPAITGAQEVEQARTAVQKTIYAWSEGMPTLMFFRLFMPEDRWTLVFNHTEPRPSVLAYRNMAEQLRHHRFVRTLDLGSADTEGYLFEEPGTGRAVLAFWTNHESPASITLDLAGAGDPRLIDLYGNASPAETLPGGAVTAVAGESPAYLVWRGSESSGATVRTARPLIDAPEPVRVVPGETTPVLVGVRNPLDRAVTATLAVPGSDDPSGQESNLAAEVLGSGFELEPGETRQVPVEVTARSVQRIGWPSQWSVFAPVPDSVDPASFGSIPDRMGGVSPTTAHARGQVVDIAPLAEGKGEKRRAVLMATVDSPRKQTITVGAAADWWMAWYLNGEPVYDTLEKGNQAPYRIDAHAFDLPLREGENLLAVEVQSGSDGWQLVTDGPEALRRLQQGEGADDRIELTLTLGDTEPVSRQVAVEWTQPLPRWSADAWEAPFAQISSRPATLIGGEAHVQNRFTSLPDPAMWWGGDADLSALAWVAHDADSLFIVVQVSDQTTTGAGADGDGLILALAPAGGGTPERYRVDADSSSASRSGMEAKVESGGGTTTYRLRAPLPGDSETVRLSLAVTDKDGEPGAPKQVLSWPAGAGRPSADADAAEAWMTFHLAKP